MTGDQAIGLAVAVALLPFVLMIVVAILDGDIRRRHIWKTAQVGLLFSSAVAISDAQGQAQAQDVMVRRVERVEDSTRLLEGIAQRQDQINAGNRELLQQITVNATDREKRLQTLEQGLVIIKASAESVQVTTEEFKSEMQNWAIIAGVIFTAISVGIAYRQEKRLTNGHSPFAAVLQELKEQQKMLQEQRAESIKVLNQILERQPQRRRT